MSRVLTFKICASSNANHYKIMNLVSVSYRIAPRLALEMQFYRSYLMNSSFTNQNWGFVLLSIPSVMVVMWLADKLSF